MRFGALSNLRIGTLLNGLFALMLLLVLGLLTKDVIHAFDEKRQAEVVVTSATTLRDVFNALQNSRVERSTLRLALGDENPAADQKRADIDALRAQSRPALQAVLAACATIDCGEGALARLSEANDKAEAIRAEGDEALKKPLAERRADIAKDWQASISAVVEALENISSALGGQIRRIDPFIGELVEIKDLGYTIRAAAGLERNFTLDAITDHGYRLKSYGEQLQLRGQIDAAWPLLQELAGRSGMPGAVIDAVAEAKKAYFEGIVPKRAEIDGELIIGQPSPVSRDEWQKATNESFEALVAVPMAALDAIVDYADGMDRDTDLALALSAGLLLGVLVLGLLGFFTVRHRVTRPIALVTAAMRHVAEGKLSEEVPYRDRKDDIGDLAAALVVFKENAVEREKAEALNRAEQEQKERRRRAVDSLVEGFDAQVTGILKVVAAAADEMEELARNMSSVAENTSRQASDSAAGAQRTLANVQTVASATEEMSGSVAEIARQVEESAKIASGAVSEAQATNGIVANLAQSAQRIGEVVSLINDIASQTNLLALNATIEAARAGEAGKGFAVVASEVKNLATQTAKATDEISAQIGEMQSATGAAVEAIKAIGGTIGRINEIASAIAAAVEEQSATTAEIARNVQQAASATGSLTGNINEVSHSAEQAGSVGERVLEAARDLARNADQLESGIETFLERIKAA
jgi:methyl-accepting chemotaxis protein